MNHCGHCGQILGTSDVQSSKVNAIHQIGTGTLAWMVRGLCLRANKALIPILVTSGYPVYIVKF